MVNTLIVGIGSPHGDDRAGWLVADALASCALPWNAVHKALRPLDLLDWLPGGERLIVCDACQQTGRKRERFWRWSWPAEEIDLHKPVGTHDISLSEVLRLAEVLGRLPSQVVVFGIPIENFAAATEPSAELLQALPSFISELKRELEGVSGRA